ncbi:unnamed protein product [Phaedon cochleariae]|uniref:Uncharacterized protein n=1 Tax=Phaedon cochleariae TaxID=80249 RepID=A0A9N9SEI0_PHACE|nr:unnamed protein product [Phaedon cochleariae]
MVDLGGYVIILVETKDKKIKLYGSPADKDNLEVGDEILEVNGKTLEDATHTEVISHIHQLNQTTTSGEELNGFIKTSPIYVTSLTATTENSNNNRAAKGAGVAGVGVVLGGTTTSVVAVDRDSLVVTGGKQQVPNGHDAQAQNAVDNVRVANDVRVAAQGDILRSLDSPTHVSRILGDRRGSSPFQNGRTELLIGAEDNNKLKTTAIVESNNNKLGIDIENRPRRRSGSSIVVLDGDPDAVKKHPDLLDQGLDYDMVMMLSSARAADDGPHREMAVDVPENFVVGYDRLLGITFGDDAQERAIDVPDNFVERKKTPPKYPTPKIESVKSPAPATTKPVPPPRDHLKIEKDGRLVNRAPAPQLPARIVNNNNVAPVAPLTPVAPAVEPTREQLDSIKKYQFSWVVCGFSASSDFEKNKMVASICENAVNGPNNNNNKFCSNKVEEDRLAAQNEFLNRSLRGSKKLQALESGPLGVANDAFEEEALRDAAAATPTEKTEKELVHRLQLQLKKAVSGGGLGGLEGRIAAVQSLLLSPHFGRALAVHNKVQAVRRRAAVRPAPVAQAALRECLDAVGGGQSAYAVELAALLTGYEFEALMVAHDGVTSILPEDSTSPTPSTSESVPQSITDHRYGEDNIKIIKIEKSTEPLGATVKNEGDAVIVGRVIRGGAAEKSGLLHEGDEILEVNGIEMRGKSINTVCDMAHFDYDPEEDMYIPCRELGIGFQKGDVLHIISQEDPNWWQAYREGEEDQTLAGLVPSQTFQHQRESVRLAAEERTSKPPRKSATLLCGRAHKRKKKRGAYADGGKFVEHGEYEKAYYGTSLDAIRSVVHAGRICVLNLHPQSLRILRTSDLKPYVVFVAPPSLEKLRQKKIRNGESYKEDELKDTIEKAREMEEKYGHFFDLIIINNDTERAYHQLLNEINSLEREPQWVPAAWVKAP